MKALLLALLGLCRSAAAEHAGDADVWVRGVGRRKNEAANKYHERMANGAERNAKAKAQAKAQAKTNERKGKTERSAKAVAQAKNNEHNSVHAFSGLPKLGYHATHPPMTDAPAPPPPTPAPPTPPPPPLSADDLLDLGKMRSADSAKTPMKAETQRMHLASNAAKSKMLPLLSADSIRDFARWHTHAPSPAPPPPKHHRHHKQRGSNVPRGAVFDDDDDGGTATPTPVPIPWRTPAPLPTPAPPTPAPTPHVDFLGLEDPEAALRTFQKMHSKAPTPMGFKPTPQPTPHVKMHREHRVFKLPRMPAHIRETALVTSAEAEYSKHGRGDDFDTHPLCCGHFSRDHALVQKFCHWKGYRKGHTLGSSKVEAFEFCVNFDGDKRLIPNDGCTFSKIMCDGWVGVTPTPAPARSSGLTSDDDDDGSRTPAPTPTPPTPAPTLAPTPSTASPTLQPTGLPTPFPTPQPTPDMHGVFELSTLKAVAKRHSRSPTPQPTPAPPTPKPTPVPTPTHTLKPMYDDDDDTPTTVPPAPTSPPTPRPTQPPTPVPTTEEERGDQERRQAGSAKSDCEKLGIDDILACQMMKMNGHKRSPTPFPTKKPHRPHAAGFLPELDSILKSLPTHAPCVSVYCQLFGKDKPTPSPTPVTKHLRKKSTAWMSKDSSMPNGRMFSRPRMKPHINAGGLVTAEEGDDDEKDEGETDFHLFPICCGYGPPDEAVANKFCHWKGFKKGKIERKSVERMSHWKGCVVQFNRRTDHVAGKSRTVRPPVRLKLVEGCVIEQIMCGNDE